MTTQEICAQVQARSGACRFCGCTRNRVCLLPGGNTCIWTDSRSTICSNPACRAKYRALQMPALHALISTRCKCGRIKSRRRAICGVCWNRLPWLLSALLYEPMGRGFACYYNEAREALKLLAAMEADTQC